MSFSGKQGRDPEVYKDKVEVSLDGRQIFYLFFGGAVIVGLVFVLGVMVGRRVEARGHIDHARTQTATDPLAALDRLESNQLSFQGALTGAHAPSDVERTIDSMERARADKQPAVKPDGKVAKPEGKPPVAKPDSLKPVVKPEPDAPVVRPDQAKVEGKPVVKPDQAKPDRPAKKSEPIAEPTNPDVLTHVDKPEKPRKPEADLAKAPTEAKAKFTLQLSSFQDKQEAESFLSSVKAAGYHAHVTEADVSGKGTFYRVRFGNYRSLDAANDAKAELEKALKKSASVMRL